MKKYLIKKSLKSLVLICLCSVGMNAQETKSIGKEIVITYTHCKDVKKTLEIVNTDLGLKEFCAEQNEFYDEKRIIDGEEQLVHIHRPTNMLMIGDSREDDYVSVITYAALYDLDGDGIKELFFAHGSAYATMLRLDILQKQNKVYKVIASGLIAAKANTFVLPHKTNGYYDIFQKSDVWNETWLYQFADKKYELVKHTNITQKDA